MNRTELVDAVVANVKEGDVVSRAQMERIVGAVFNTIKTTVADGGEVAIVGFGTFKSVEKKAKDGRNPQTGEAIKIPARTAPKFIAGKSFKDAVNK